MEHLSVDINLTGTRNSMVKDYLENHSRLSEFYKWPVGWDSFDELIKLRSEIPIDRITLREELEKQHLPYFDKYPQIKLHIDAISSEKTFTVTTGHQLCLATGPLYFLYKIISTINLAKELKQRYPENQFIPVYWMASEDHDFEEINHIHLFNKKLKWNQPVKGVAGKIPTDSMGDFLDELKSILGESDTSLEVLQLLSDAYLMHANLADATRFLVLHLFGKYGLLVLDADRPQLKKLFSEIIREELTDQASFKLVTNVNNKLEEHYHLPVSPRPINLFYLDTELRERIVQSPEGHFEVINTDLVFTSEFILDLAQQQPERFSPNVVLRPVYQEVILPNLAYIGGPGEISYLLQFKTVFDHYGVFFPMLIPRNHALIIEGKQWSKFKTLGFAAEDLFKTVDILTAKFVKGLENVPSSIEEDSKRIADIFTEIAQKLSQVDSTLHGAVQAELQRSQNGLDNIGKKLQAALKRQNDTAVNQIQNIVDKVNPSHQPQERFLNFIPFYLKYKDVFIDELISTLKPFDPHLTILIEGDS